MNKDIAEIIDIMNMADDFRPIVTKGIEILKSYGPELKELMTDMVMATADMKIAVIKKYRDAGFTKQEAIDMCMDQWYQMARAARSYQSKSK